MSIPLNSKALLVVNARKDTARAAASELSIYLQSLGFSPLTVVFDNKAPILPPLDGISIIFSFGGDGTVLFSSRIATRLSVPVFPINCGTLGFIAGIALSSWRENVNLLISGDLPFTDRTMLGISIERAGSLLSPSFVALNDGVISGSGIAKIVNIGIRIDDSFVATYSSDGIIVATSTGSTAYSLASGGPILPPDMDAMIFNPISPFTFANRAIVVPSNSTISASVELNQRSTIVLTIDGQESRSLETGDIIHFTGFPEKVRLFQSPDHSFYEILRKKLNWSGGPDA